MNRHHNLLPGISGGGTISALRGRSAFSLIRNYIETESKDVTILVVGDSTGNEATEWVYLGGEWIASQYPNLSVSYELWNDGAGSYDAPTTIQTGTGARTVTFKNASIGGAQPYYLAGAKRAAAIDAVTPDLIIINHGHNAVSLGSVPLQRGEIAMCIEACREAHPSVPVAVFTQNPYRDDNNYAPINGIIRSIAAEYGDVTLLDAYTPFIAAGKPASWYADNIHPTGEGQQVFLRAFQSAWYDNGFALEKALMARSIDNLLVNGDFAAFDAAVPDGWTALGSVTATKELSIVDGDSPYSVKLTGTSAGGRLHKAITDVSAVAGGKASLAVRLNIPAGSASSVGRVAMSYVDGGSTILTTRASTVAQGAYRWAIISGMDIPSTATAVNAAIYCDTAANASSAAYYDRVIVVPGEFPRDMA